MATQISQAELSAAPGTQANISKQRRKFPPIANSSLAKVAEQYRFSRFNLSPLSPQAFGPHAFDSQYSGNDDGKTSKATKKALLERYLGNGQRRAETDGLKKSHISLAGVGIADALPTPGYPPNIWEMLQPQADPGERKSTGTVADSLVFPTTPVRNVDTEKPLPEIPQSRIFVKRRASTLTRRPNSILFLDPPGMSSNIPVAANEHEVDGQRTWPKVPWSQDDSGLLTPPPVPGTKGWTYSFEFELPQVTLGIERSIFDPPLAPFATTFPETFPESPKFSKPYPLDTTKTITKQTGSAMNSPIVPEDREKAVMVAQKPPSAPITDAFPIKFPASPARSGPSPIDTSRSREMAAFDALDTGNVTPTQPLRAPISGDFPPHSHRPTPLTLNNSKQVRFAVLKSPSLSNLKSPSYNDNIFRKKVATPSPSLDSPVTPEAMTFADPKIVSSTTPSLVSEDLAAKYVLDIIPPLQSRGRSERRQTIIGVRARTLSPSPRDQASRDRANSVLPQTKYDPTIVYDESSGHRKLVWPSQLPRVPYHVSSSLADDRKKILQSYFNRTLI